jgi:hypothetical protein
VTYGLKFCKGKFTPKQAIMAERGGGAEVYLWSFFNLGVGWSSPRPVPFYCRDKDPVLIVTEVCEPVDNVRCQKAHSVLTVHSVQ